MNIFLGDYITVIKETKAEPTLVSGKCTGIVLDNNSEVERVYIAGIDGAFFMSSGWKFVDNEEDENAEI